MVTETERQLAPSCPQALRPHLLAILDRGRILALILDAEGSVLWGNRAFSEALLSGRPAGVKFSELLDEDSARLLAHLGPLHGEDQTVLDLRHPSPTGHRTVTYQLFSLGTGMVGALGSDRTEEIELLAKMSALVEDLHREIDHRAELSKELERMATTDFLTGVSNRRQFDKLLRDEWGRMKRYHSHFALLLIDLDRFKEVNDRFGHQAGDEVLKGVALTLQDEVRAEDLVARYGGEEFAIVALSANAENGRDLGERLRKRIQAMPLPAGVPEMTITVGIAATQGLEPDANLFHLVTAADDALYRGKQKGRNRVEVHGAPS